MEATDLRFALWPQFLLTARHHAARSAMAVKDQAEKGAIFEDSAALFESMLIAAADLIGEAAQEIAAELDKIEDRVLSDALSDESATLLRLRRGISRQERLVQAAHSVLAATRTKPRRECPSGVSRPGFTRAAAGRRLSGRPPSAGRSRAALAGGSGGATRDRDQSQPFRSHGGHDPVLPPAFVTGFFGMNTKGLPFGDSDYGTMYATMLCLLAAGVAYLIIRRYRAVS